MITTLDFFIFLCTCAICNYSITASQNETDEVPFEIVVKNILEVHDEMTYGAFVVPGGILLGGMKRLRESNASFTFTYHENFDYGPFLDSVNHVYGNPEDHTYWELLVKKPDGEPIRTNVGIGCYIPSPNDQVIFNFTKW